MLLKILKVLVALWSLVVLISSWAILSNLHRDTAPIASTDSVAARPIGRAGFVKTDSFDIAGDGLSGENVFLTQKNVLCIFTDCIPDTGDLLYPARVNDSLFVMVWLNQNLVK